MRNYSILLRRQNYPANFTNLLQDLEHLKLPGRWAGLLAPNDTRFPTLKVWFEEGKFKPVERDKFFSSNWMKNKNVTIALLRTMEFADKDLIRDFITGLDIQDFEFYAIARGKTYDFEPGFGWYGIVSMGVVEFEEEGDIIELLRS